MRVALRVNDRERIEQCFAATPDPLEKQQLAFLLARQVRLSVRCRWLSEVLCLPSTQPVAGMALYKCRCITKALL